MRSDLLRDVVAGCAGVVAVVVAIGLPGGTSSAGSSVPVAPAQSCARLLPVYKGTVRVSRQMCPPPPVRAPLPPAAPGVVSP